MAPQEEKCSKCSSVPIKSLFGGPKEERDACGVGFLVDMNGSATSSLLRQAETMSARMEHRGACSCDNLTGDGAGVMTSIPHELYADRLMTEGSVQLPPLGAYATGLIFLDPSSMTAAMSLFERLSRRCGLRVLAWSSPPTNDECLGSVARNSEPLIKQVFLVEERLNEQEEEEDESIKAVKIEVDKVDFDQKIFFLRKWSTHEILARGLRFYICSLSSALIVYKGQFTPPQLWRFYLDLQDERFKCYLALVHARFSTNTFPSWDRAQPLRMLAHNGEINTLRGNVNLMRAREGVMTSPVYSSLLSKLYPVVEPDSSDSGSLDNVLEFLFRAGSERSLPESVITMVPEAFTPVTREGGVSRRPSAVFSAEGPGAAAAGDGTLHPPPGTQIEVSPSELTSPTSDNSIINPLLAPINKQEEVEMKSAEKVLDPDFKEQLKFEDEKRSFFQWASTSMEAWDGPALLTFSDGRYVGAILDRNGLRPSRYIQTKAGIVAMASEVGVTDFLDQEVVHKGRLKPGRMLLVDTRAKCLARDTSLKQEIFQKRPFKEWLKESLLFLPDLIGSSSSSSRSSKRRVKEKRQDESELLQKAFKSEEEKENETISSYQRDPRLTLFGWNQETMDTLIAPMVSKGTKKEALGSMGNDAALACVSLCQPLLYEYFKQVFAQVTNPPIDPFREKIVMSLACPVGPESNLLVPSKSQCARLWLHQPILSNREMARLKVSLGAGKSGSLDPSSFLSTLNLDGAQSGRKNAAAKWRSQIISCLFPIPATCNEEGALGSSLKQSLARICKEAEDAANSGNVQILILSDRIVPEEQEQEGQSSVLKEKVLAMAPIPALLSLGAIHQHLISTRTRMKVALFVETGEAREIHHLCCLLGYGADAINPYIVFEAMARVMKENAEKEGKLLDLHKHVYHEEEEVFENYCVAAETGICKVMAKMGISTLQSYKGAQIFEAVGLGPDVIELGFKNTASRIAGADMDTIALEVVQRHALAFKLSGPDSLILRNPGYLHWRPGGERHVNEPQAVALLQEAAKTNSARAYKEYVKWSRASIRSTTLRGNLALNYPPEEAAISVEQVETSCEDILKRFCTGAMSFGSISIEAHESLARAMNKIGGKSNTGEGGEGPWRLYDAGTRSSIKQVASGRFGVTSAYLANADELQIKMAQGAKPGEGGELPGFKVTVDIAATRKSVPGVGLISPPPHHDIYSIEDLAQLIYDLKCANPRARISVKLVSVVGVGIVASGVAKGKAEHITISGHDGGTGASSWTGIKGAGLPWELGLSETHQVLVANDLRSRVTVQVDGQIRSAFDVLVAAALGADEFALSTAPLIVLGCTMMRKCHLNTCPVGVATQDPVLRAKFTGVPEHVVNFFWLLAQEIREEMARLGIRKFSDLIGKTDILKVDPSNPKAAKLDFDAILCDASKLTPDGSANSFLNKLSQDFALEKRKDNLLIQLLQDNQLLPANLNDDQKIFYAARAQERESMSQRSSSVDVVHEMQITNVDRTFGTTVSCEVSRFWGEEGIPRKVGSLTIRARGSAGQSLGAWLAPGIKIILEGDSNDYVAKGLSGGNIILFPPKVLTDQVHDGHLFRSENNVIAGNVCLYGATSGTALFRGILGERAFVRNSGAFTVCEGIGDHGCEYMTGGLALILGPIGRNFGAGMSGGVAYIYCVDHQDPETVAAVERACEGARKDSEESKLKELARKLKLMTANRANLSSIDIFDSFESSEAPHLLEEGNIDELAGCTFGSEVSSARGWCDGSDAGAVTGFLTEFVRETGSSVARGILENWNQKRHFFIKIFPKEYQKVMKEALIQQVEVQSKKREASPPTAEMKKQVAARDIEDVVLSDSRQNVGVKLDKVKGFLRYKRIKGYYRQPDERLKDWREVYDIDRIRSEARVQASRCMDCGIPFCQSNSTGCPLGNLIPAWNNLVHGNEWDKSVLSLLQTNNFPEFTGRVCPAPCEGSCVLGINSDPVAIKSVELSISESGFESGLIPRTVLESTGASPKSGLKVAVIGSGPAGLAAAAQLAVAGHEVTVIERQPLPGGLLQYGIPSMKLEKGIIARRINLMRQQGITFVCGVDVGNPANSSDFPIERFKSNEFAAIVLAVGATWPRDLTIPGREDTDGIHFAMEFLGSDRVGDWRDENSKISAAGKRVIVVGGGDTGCDCIGTSLREGATSVISFEILPQPPDARDCETNPWPNWPKIFRTDYGHEEVRVQRLAGGEARDPRIYNICSKEFVTRKERDPATGLERNVVAGIRTVKVEWTQGEGGAWKMAEVAGSEQVFEADLVLLALGFLGPESYLAQSLGLELDPRFKTIVTSKGATESLLAATSAGAGINYHVAGKVFTCGDCRRGQSLVVHAINEGRQAARAVDEYLKKGESSGSALSVSGGLVMPPFPVSTTN